MGRRERAKPQRLAGKLAKIRLALNLTAEEMIKSLDYPALPIYRASITEYEKGKREPPLLILLQYARVANIFLEVLVDDQLDLPDKIPATEKSLGINNSDSQ